MHFKLLKDKVNSVVDSFHEQMQRYKAYLLVSCTWPDFQPQLCMFS